MKKGKQLLPELTKLLLSNDMDSVFIRSYKLPRRHVRLECKLILQGTHYFSSGETVGEVLRSVLNQSGEG